MKASFPGSFVLRACFAKAALDWESRHLLYIEWINNKVLLLHRELYIQYAVINHNGKQ